MSEIKEFIKHNRFTRIVWLIYKKGKLRKEAASILPNVSYEGIQKFHNTKQGKRCFIVGNGPSLKIEDLERIKQEDSFAVNRIYKIFDKTDWRPTYFFCQDTKVLEEIATNLQPVIESVEGVFLNAGVEIINKYKNYENVYQFLLISLPYDRNLPKFSMNPAKGLYEGYTVAYACIQMAVYMGYSEIYIIGTDHNYNINKCSDGSVTQDNTVKNYMPGLEGNLWFLPQVEKSTLAYRKARSVCEKNGIKIANATRGGKLEEFSRIDFDSLFE